MPSFECVYAIFLEFCQNFVESKMLWNFKFDQGTPDFSELAHFWALVDLKWNSPDCFWNANCKIIPYFPLDSVMWLTSFSNCLYRIKLFHLSKYTV